MDVARLLKRWLHSTEAGMRRHNQSTLKAPSFPTMPLVQHMMAFVLLLVFSTLSSSAPTVNQSNLDPHLSHPILRDVPNGPEFVRYRTTSQIVWACLSTIFACAWVAIHPNIPGPHDSGFQKFRRRITMMNATILAPEFIVLWALRQRTVAKRTKKRFNDKYFGGVDPEAVSYISQIKQWFKSPPPAPAPGWALTHAFFVQMGGLMAYHDGEPVKVLTFERLVQSIDRGEVDIPQIFIEEISDKSKGDLLSKLAVVVQTSWFVAQCVTRWWSHLPLSDLEVLTLGFAALNAFVFWIWWHKPQGVMVPIRVVLKQAPKQDPVATLPESPKPLPTIADESNGSQTEDASEYLFDKESWCFPRVAWPLWRDNLWRKCESIGPSPFFHCVCFYISFPFLFLFTLIHWIGRTAAKTILAWHYPVKFGTKEVLVTVSRTRVPMFHAGVGDAGASQASLVTIVGIIFGGIHLSQWSASFPSWVECLLWRVSALAITVGPLVVGIFGDQLIKMTGPFLANSLKSERVPTPNSSIWSLYAVGVCGCIYFLARLVMIFLSFFTLRNLPDDVYHNIQWSEVFPHI